MAALDYLYSLDISKLLKNLPGGVAQGILWGLMALGVYITFRLLNVSDLTVEGSFATGGAVTVVLITGGGPQWLRALFGAGEGNFPAWAALLMAFAAGVLTGIVVPIAAGLMLLFAPVLSPWMPALLGFAAGAMLFVVMTELAARMGESGWGTVCFAIGFVLMCRN